jgi:hypothetical protein
LIQCDGFGILALHVRQQASHVHMQQSSSCGPGKTACESCQKLSKQFAKFCDIFNLHGATLRGFRVKLFDTRRVAVFPPSSQHH